MTRQSATLQVLQKLRWSRSDGARREIAAMARTALFMCDELASRALEDHDAPRLWLCALDRWGGLDGDPRRLGTDLGVADKMRQAWSARLRTRATETQRGYETAADFPTTGLPGNVFEAVDGTVGIADASGRVLPIEGASNAEGMAQPEPAPREFTASIAERLRREEAARDAAPTVSKILSAFGMKVPDEAVPLLSRWFVDKAAGASGNELKLRSAPITAGVMLKWSNALRVLAALRTHVARRVVTATPERFNAVRGALAIVLMDLGEPEADARARIDAVFAQHLRAVEVEWKRREYREDLATVTGGTP